MKKIIMTFVLILFAMPVYALDGQQLLVQIDRNLNPESYEMYRKIINVEPDKERKKNILSFR